MSALAGCLISVGLFMVYIVVVYAIVIRLDDN